MKLIKIYASDSQTHIINAVQIVEIIKPIHSDHNKTEIHLSNGKILITETLPKDLEDKLNEL
jgi:hypothetical protein